MQRSLWNGFEKIDFTFEGRPAVLVLPKLANANKCWLFKTEYFGAFPNFEIEMLKRGWHLAFVRNSTRWALEGDLDLQRRFIAHIASAFGLNEKCVAVGMSCGGLIAAKLAAKYPEAFSALYLDAPVLNLLSCPGDVGLAKSGLMEEFTRATGMTKSELTYYRDHPIDKLPRLLESGIPIVLVYGDSDEIVPYSENGAVLEKYYREKGGTLLAIEKKGCGHHPHGLEDCGEIIEFIEKYAN